MKENTMQHSKEQDIVQDVNTRTDNDDDVVILTKTK